MGEARIVMAEEGLGVRVARSCATPTLWVPTEGEFAAAAGVAVAMRRRAE